MNKVKHIFISKDANSSVLLCDFLTRKAIPFTAKSLLFFKQVDLHTTVPDADILFFASSRSFDFYVAQRKIGHEKIACAGEATALHIQSNGYSVDYFPKNSGAVTAASMEFANWVGKRKVLFSVSNLSKLSYGKQLNESQVIVVPTYETIYESQQIPFADMLVFTSPSNVDAFLMFNKIIPQTQVVAWGETTASHLEKKGIDVQKTLTISDDSALIVYLKELGYDND